MHVHIRAERSTNVPSIAPRERASMPIVPFPAHRSRNLPALILRASNRNMASRVDRGETELIISRFSSSSPWWRPSVICSSEVMRTGFTLSHGFFVFGRDPGRGGGILLSDAAERFLRKRFFPPPATRSRESPEVFGPLFWLD